MGGAERYPSIAFYGDDGFRRLNPSYVLNLYGSFAASVDAKTDSVDNKTGSSDLPVGQFVDGGVESRLKKYFRFRPPQITSRTFRIPPHRGAYRDRHGRGVGCGGRGSVLRAMGLQGGVFESVSDQRARGREMLLRTAKSCGPDAPTLASSSRRF